MDEAGVGLEGVVGEALEWWHSDFLICFEMGGVGVGG